MALRRHRLVRLTPQGWDQAATQHEGCLARRCFAHWLAYDLPVVVATQTVIAADGVSLGLPAPAAWGRARLSLLVARSDVRTGTDVFPALSQCGFTLAAELPGIRVHGSFGWQQITGLRYVHGNSDLDLLIPVSDAEQADHAVRILAGERLPGRRLDGELLFTDGSAVAWREWHAWRAGKVDAVLVKRLRGASLEHDVGWLRVIPEGAAA